MAHTIDGLHCQQCGNTQSEDVNDPDLDGYSGCCNEIIVSRCDRNDTSRPEEDRTCYHD